MWGVRWGRLQEQKWLGLGCNFPPCQHSTADAAAMQHPRKGSPPPQNTHVPHWKVKIGLLISFAWGLIAPIQSPPTVAFKYEKRSIMRPT